MGSPDIFLERGFERNPTLTPPTTGVVAHRLWQIYHIDGCVRDNDSGRQKSMNWRQRILLVLVLLPFARVALHPAHAQTRVGEAVLVQNEVARVAGTLSMQRR
ncbi:hypothetical protein [Bradyrhizobium sp.]|uniref:hypothetical protein n=1 Tax=Bradyrhizobium sp. TaxID=376 RepID=UPI003C6F9615